MRRTYGTGLLVLGLLLASGEANHADAFGGMLKGMAKKKAKDHANRQAKKEVEKATGVNVDQITSIASDPKAALQSQAQGAASEATGMDLSGGAGGVAAGLKDKAMGMATGMLPAGLQQYAGMNKDQVLESVKAQVYEEKGLTRFSRMGERRAADSLAKERADGILNQLAGAATGDGSGLSSLAEGLLGGEAGGAMGEGREAAMARIRAEIYNEKGVTAGTTGLKKRMADAMVESRMKALFGN